MGGRSSSRRKVSGAARQVQGTGLHSTGWASRRMLVVLIHPSSNGPLWYRRCAFMTISNPKQDMTPDRIRAIRKRLGLTQEEAGAILGGGPRAFTKYESGSMRPRAAMSNLLRVLEEYPETVWVLRGDEGPPAVSRAPSPFEVQGRDLADLRPGQLHELLRRLLSVEAQANGIPLDGIQVSSNIAERDGGEDGRISWQDGPKRTGFLPSRLCQFQLKAGGIKPSEAGREVLARSEVKPMVRSVLEQGGHYILLCARRYPQEAIEKREKAIHEALREAGLSVPPKRISFRDTDMIAQWVNAHPSVALWVRETVGLARVGRFASWPHWRGRSEHAVPWVEDSRLPGLRSAIRERVTRPGRWLRVVGPSGVGKSRLCLEALGGLGDDPAAGRPLRDLVMYAVQSEVPGGTLPGIVEQLAGSGARAVVVVDDCDPETHDDLVRLVRRAGTGVSLLTIDYELPSELATGTHEIDEAAASVVEAIVEHVAGTLSPLDRQRLAVVSAGFPEVARRIGDDAGATQFVDPRPDRLIDSFVVGRTQRDADVVLRSATLLSVFRLVQVDQMGTGWRDPSQVRTTEDFLAPVAAVGRHLTGEDLYAATQRLAQRGVFKRRGGLGAIQPRPIAVRLAERQWKEWDPGKWDRVLSGSLGPGLTRVAAERLAHLNDTGIGTEVVQHVCREGGPFDTGAVDNNRAEVIASLAEVDAAVVAEYIERLLDCHPDPSRLDGNVRHTLMRALARIAFPAATFPVGARLMLRLLGAGNGTDDEHAARPLTALFPAMAGATEAGGQRRLRFLDEVSATSDATRTMQVVRALAAGCDPVGQSSAIGPEVQGSRRTLNRWHPATTTELTEYVGGCISRLAGLASRNDEVGVMCREELGGSIASLVHRGFIGPVEDAIRRVAGAGHRWTLALRQLHGVFVHFPGSIDEATSARVRSVIDLLTPTDLHDRVRALVTESPMPHDLVAESPSEHFAALRRKMDALSDELLRTPETLRELLPGLSRGKHLHVGELGESIARRAARPLDWLDPIIAAVEHAPEARRNHALFVGFVAGLTDRHGEQVEAVRQRVIETPALAPAFPEVCRRIGLTPENVERGVAGLVRGTIPSSALLSWVHPETLHPLPRTAVARLLDALLDRDAISFAIGVNTLWLILDSEDREGRDTRETGLRLADLRDQVLTMARNAGRWSARDFKPATGTTDPRVGSQMTEWKLTQVILSLLRRGRDDELAREAALAFSTALVHRHRDGWLDVYGKALRPVIRKLLSGFPGIAWQLIGGAIVSSPGFARLMALSLGERPIHDREADPPILGLSEETLLAWCHAHLDQAPAFAASCLPIVSAAGGDPGDRRLHPVMSRLIDEFGERADVREAFETNLFTTGPVSSLADHDAGHEAALEPLRGHGTPEVRRWARRLSRKLRQLIAHERTYEEEHIAGLE